MAIEAGLISGVCVGIEFHFEDNDPDIKSAVVLDLFIVRIVFAFFK